MRAHSPVEDTIRTRVEEHPETYTWAEVLSSIQRAAKGVLATKYDRNSMQMILDSTGVQPGETLYTSCRSSTPTRCSSP